MLSKIWVWDPGSGKTYSRSRIQGSKRHRIPDPDPQHSLKGWILIHIRIQWIRIHSSAMYKPAIPISKPCSILFAEAIQVELCTLSAGSPTRTSLAWREPHAARQPPQPPRWVSSCLVSRIFFTRNSTLQRNLNLCIPRKGIAWPPSKFPH